MPRNRWGPSARRNLAANVRGDRYEIRSIAALQPIAEIYREVGFRPDLVDDLAFLRDLGGSVFVATAGDDVVGASSCLSFGRTGWIGGVAVTAAHRNSGLGTKLTEAAMRTLREGGVETLGLHATAQAQSIYERLGFAAEAEFVELSDGGALTASDAELRAGTAEDLDAVLALDRLATGEGRGLLLSALWPHHARVALDGERVVGFALPQGRSSAGAVIAVDEAAGDALLAALVGAGVDRLHIGASTRHERLLARLDAAGYSETLRTTRMYLGPPPALVHEKIFATFNLYWG